MPLIVVCGNPCTGKTGFSNKLLEYLLAKGVTNVELINEESLKINKKVNFQM